jgi:hypothetical protein
MGYQFNKFFPLHFAFWHGPQLLTSIRRDVVNVVNFDDPNVWVQTCEQCTTLFKIVMPMTMENLAIDT